MAESQSPDRLPARFAGRVAVVTGGASGIGLASADRLLREGCCVYIADIRAEVVQETAAALAARGLDARPLPVDVTDPASLRSAWKAVADAHGGFDVLINSAGIEGSAALAVDTPDEEWEDVIRVNLGGTFYACKYAIPYLQQAPRDSVIVNIASVSGLHAAFPGDSPYCASKGGVVALTKVLSVELAPSGVRVVAICPGTTATPLIESLLERNAPLEDTLRTLHPLGRWAQPEEIANLVAFAASSEASFLTGATIAIDGGRSQH